MDEEKYLTFDELLEKYKPYLQSLWKNKWKIILVNTIVAIVAVLYLLFLTKNYYTSSVTILPDYGSKSPSIGALSGLAAMAGVSVGKAEPTEIYAELIKSETVLSEAIYKKYLVDEYPDSVNLIDYFEIKSDKEKSIEYNNRKNFTEAYEKLTKKISTNVDRMTKILTLEVTIEDPKLSSDLANTIVQSLDHYIKNKRKSNVTEERFYIEKRVEQVKDTLKIIEERIEKFNEQNRSIMQSPKLLIEQARLQREMQITNTVYVELQKQLELSKIEQIKDSPVVNVKEYADIPIKKAGPKRLNNLIIIMFLTFTSIILYYLFKEPIKNLIKSIKSKLS